jgi:hypothetical protein
MRLFDPRQVIVIVILPASTLLMWWTVPAPDNELR